MDSTRDRLVFTALKLFGEKGYLSTSVADILKEAGANSGSLYHAFPTKQDLLVAVLETYQAGIYPMLLAPAWEGVDDPLERVFALLARYRMHLEITDCLYGCPIGSVALELHEPDPVVRELLAQNFTGWTRAIGGCLREGAERLPPNTNIQALAEFILTTMEGGVMQARTHREIAYFDRSISQLRHHMALLAEVARLRAGGVH